MYGIPYFNELAIKAHVEALLIALAAVEPPDLADQAPLCTGRPFASRLGAVLIRLGTSLERSDRALDQVGS